MEEEKEKKFIKNRVARKRKRRILIIVLAFLIIASAGYYWLTIDDGTYDEDDWGNTPYANGEYVNGISVNSNDGTLSSNTSTQELWDKMLENKSRVDLYLDNPEELARLMKAEIVTQYPDTRQNPDEEINWKDIIENADRLQGIIKFKRADSNHNASTMTYADSDKFYDWIELYAQTGDETYKKQALSHFTLSQNSGADSTAKGDGNSSYTTKDMKTNCSDAIVKAAKETGSPGSGLCQKWVRLVYAKAGLGNASYATAYQAFKSNCVSTSKDNIPIGAAVYGTGSGSSAGHVGIYIGNGQVMDNIGTIRTQSLEDWIAWQEKNPTVIAGEKSGWLGWGWQSESPKILGTTAKDDKQANRDESATGKTSSSSKASYTAVVATWEQVDTTVNTNDPNVKNSIPTQYSMTTTNINYEEMVKNYTMPFDLLWAFLVVGEDKNFVFDLADLVYQSDIQITIHDNLTVNTDIDKWNYTEQTKAVVDAEITANCKEQSATDSIKNDVHDPHEEKTFETTKTVVTQTNTVDVALTKANTWIVDYQNDYTYVAPKETETSNEVKKKDEEYKKNPDRTEDSYSCNHIETKKNELREKVQQLAKQAIVSSKETQNNTNANINTNTTTETSEEELPPVTFAEKIKAEYYSRYVNISDMVTNKVKTQEYTQGTPTVTEKTDPESKEANFVTIFNKYKKNKSNIRNVSSWLFEIIEKNESTADMIDMVKYLLYKATGRSYGVEEYDFSEYDASLFTKVSGDFLGDTTQEKVWFALKAAGYSNYATAAVMGNIQCESGFDGNKIEKGSGVGFGLCQWSYGRRQALEKYAKKKNQKPGSIDLQIEFLLAELTPGGGANGCASHQLGGLSSANYDGKRYKRKDWEKSTDLDTSTMAFMALFERPSYDSNINHIDQRRAAAKKYYNQFKDKEIPTANGSSIEVAKGTAEQKLKYLFPNGIPTKAKELKTYMSTVEVPITKKNGTKTTANLTIHKQLVSDVQDVFKTVQDNGFRIYEAMGYSYRKMNNGGSGKLSHHSYGVAIDINVNENYSHRGSTVYAGSFWNPSKSKYSIPKDGILVKAFKAKGWKWGGNWSGNYQDYMHFSFTGN